MEDGLNGITNGALIRMAADQNNTYELRLRAGRKAISEYVAEGNTRGLESKVYCDDRLPREVRVEAGLELVKHAAAQGRDLMLMHLRNSPFAEVREAACKAFGTAPGENRWKPPLGKISLGDKAVARA